MKPCPRCHELVGDNVDECFNCHYDFASIHNAAKKNVLARREADRQKILAKCESVNKIAYEINDIYEYEVVSIVDSKTGAIDVNLLKKTLQEYGMEGWRLVNSFTNEIGHNVSSLGVAGISTGTNATIDQTLLIFERCIKRYNKE